MNHWFAIAIGGSIGAVLRYAVSLWSRSAWGVNFPYGTLIVNVVGSFLLGFLVIVLTQKVATPIWMRQLLFVGVLGAFTTFSSFSLESVELFQAGKELIALKNMAFNLIGSVLAAALGLYVGKMLI